jgi:DNA invertase Pin-like site-specific DNA recombinase
MNTQKRKRRRKATPIPTVASEIIPRERQEDEPFLVGYVRVSTSDQDSQRQVDELVRVGVDPRDIFHDKASGKNMNRPGWELLWKKLEPGDVLVVHELDRLGRDTLELIRTVRDLREKGVHLKVLTMPFDTRTPEGKLVFTIIAAMAQYERRLILERTMSGLARARERGIVGGAKAKRSDDEVAAAIEAVGGPGAPNAFLRAAKALGYSKVQVTRRWNAIQVKNKGGQ